MKNKILDCNHKWKSTLLIYTTVQDCEFCKVKKEDWDNKYRFEKKEKENKEESWEKWIIPPF